jgi:hypothetical protein
MASLVIAWYSRGEECQMIFRRIPAMEMAPSSRKGMCTRPIVLEEG